ncbi:MAG: 1,4-beta-xylanase [Bacteroidales bacterium]
MKAVFVKTSLLAIIAIMLISCNNVKRKNSALNTEVSRIWSLEKAATWGNVHPWYRGSNFNPSTAVNQLETWQSASFDSASIDRELGWAGELGFNCMRVYLHHLAWEVDKTGFKSRMNTYLGIADRHGIKTIFVFFDDCWNPVYQAGVQPKPKTGIHNSGWVQDPGSAFYLDNGQFKDSLIPILEAYVKDVLSTFSKDERIALWDLYNEPGNTGHGDRSMHLLRSVFKWAREINPDQPLSVGVWNKDLVNLNAFQLENSDIITYHNYADEVNHKQALDSLKHLNKPLICTEYMARPRNSRFENIMPLLKENKIGAINWGLVSGKTNTIYAWDTPVPDGSEPTVWFHDIFRADGTAYSPDEIELIRKLTDKKQ